VTGRACPRFSSGAPLDRPVSTFGQFGDERVNIVARELDENLENVLQKAANSFD
jgi:hypothetical protein